MLLNRFCFVFFILISSSMQKYLPIKLFHAMSFQGEGEGAKVMRAIGISKVKNIDPFLMLDLFSVKLPAGFPDHPHRGFQTMSYLISGSVYHEDFKGHKGILGPYDVQVMTAGKGILHAEMPGSFDEPAYGFQLWINLKGQEKLCDPDYKEYSSDKIIKLTNEKYEVRIVVGTYDGKKALIENRTPMDFLDFQLFGNGETKYKANSKWNTFVIVYEGTVLINGQKFTKNTAVYFNQANEGEEIVFQNPSEKESTKFICVSGQPINEPIFKYGPFVMSNEKELSQAFEDYQLQQNGFEGSLTWKSTIRDMKYKKK